jgi:hypothetical protein
MINYLSTTPRIYMGEWGYSSTILDLGARCRWLAYWWLGRFTTAKEPPMYIVHYWLTTILSVSYIYIYMYMYWYIGIPIGYGLWGQGSIPDMGRFFSSPQHTDRPWGPPSPGSNGYRGLFPWDYSSRGVKLTTHLHLVPKSRMVELYFHSPICLHGIVLN